MRKTTTAADRTGDLAPSASLSSARRRHSIILFLVGLWKLIATSSVSITSKLLGSVAWFAFQIWKNLDHTHKNAFIFRYDPIGAWIESFFHHQFAPLISQSESGPRQLNSESLSFDRFNQNRTKSEPRLNGPIGLIGGVFFNSSFNKYNLPRCLNRLDRIE